MRIRQRLLLLAAVHLILLSNVVSAQNAIHPVIPGDFADPSIIRADNKYYAIGTSSEWAPHFPIYTSSDLINWKQTGYLFDKAPAWTMGSFWAPEYDYHDGTYYIYYTARRKKDQISCIGVATSKYPDRGFVDHGVIIDHGKEAIDAFVFLDKGIRYMTYKAYGLDDRPIEILGVKLSKDGLRSEGEPFSMLKDDQRKGLEGQSILKKDNYYYLFYSAGNCCGIQCDYNVGVARSKSFEGPYEKYAGNPLLAENASWKCSGHGTFAEGANGKLYYLYHAYNKQTALFSGRQGMLAELIWPGQNEWPLLKEQSGPELNPDIKLSFKDSSLDLGWQWDFRNSGTLVSQNAENLHLSGKVNDDNLAGIALTRRPVSGVFEALTTVVNSNNALKGLTYYGDATAAVGVGVTGNTVQFWSVQNKANKILASAHLPTNELVQLKLKTTADLRITAFFKQGNQEWQELKVTEEPKAESLTQWDRSPRIGLHFKGKPAEEAVFSSFDLKYMPQQN
ncbi:glycoside hydrolase family 43 protein [Pedobacter antarcticus]|uniref:glycoside hydrolase family 43 protein n=1 Tax=Pedobacter antarcticus TaxID=34086 RepID=UPI00088F78E1|nr:glycoside hydrolase family 43 protein [Pedobacter antarcticus]SDM61099.1 Beta-xylosidase [Pedobacter antarcticus]